MISDGPVPLLLAHFDCARVRSRVFRGVFRGRPLRLPPPPLKVKKIDGGRAIEALEARGPPDSIV